jgi:hypothetical protein
VGNIVGYTDVTSTYYIRFEMKILEYDPAGNWPNIIHVGESNNHRVPGLWFLGPTQGVTDGHRQLYYEADANGAAYPIDIPLLEVGSVHVVEMSLLKAPNGQCTQKLVLDGNEISFSSGPTNDEGKAQCGTTYSNQPIYFGDPWYTKPIVQMRNLLVQMPAKTG